MKIFSFPTSSIISIFAPSRGPGERGRTLNRERPGEAGRARGVADYIAGMTDRYVIKEHERIFDPVELT